MSDILYESSVTCVEMARRRMSSWLFRFPLFLASNERDAVMVRFSSSARFNEPLDDEELDDGVGDGRREWY